MKAQVLLPKVFNFPFTYNVELKCKIGDIVEVPFQMIFFFFGVTFECQIAGSKPKNSQILI